MNASKSKTIIENGKEEKENLANVNVTTDVNVNVNPENSLEVHPDLIPAPDKIEAQRQRQRKAKSKTTTAAAKTDKAIAKKQKRLKTASDVAAIVGDIDVTKIILKDVADAVLGDIAAEQRLSQGDQSDIHGSIWYAPDQPEKWISDDVGVDNGFMPENESGIHPEEANRQADVKVDVGVDKVNAKPKKVKPDSYVGTIGSFIARSELGKNLFDGGRDQIRKQSADKMEKCLKVIKMIEAFMGEYGHIRNRIKPVDGNKAKPKSLEIKGFDQKINDIIEALEGLEMIPESAVYFSGHWCQREKVDSMLALFMSAPVYKPGSRKVVDFYETLYQIMQKFYRASGEKVHFFRAGKKKDPTSDPRQAEMAIKLLNRLEVVSKAASKAKSPLSPLSRTEWLTVRRNIGISFPKSYYHPEDGVVVDGQLERTIENPKFKQMKQRFLKLITRERNKVGDDNTNVLSSWDSVIAESFAQEISGKWLNAEQIALEWEIVLDSVKDDTRTAFNELFQEFISDYLHNRQKLAADVVKYQKQLQAELGQIEGSHRKEWLLRKIQEATPTGWEVFVDGHAYKKEEPEVKTKKGLTPPEVVKAAIELQAQGFNHDEIIEIIHGDGNKPVLASLTPAPANDNDRYAEDRKADEDVESLHEHYPSSI